MCEGVGRRSRRRSGTAPTIMIVSPSWWFPQLRTPSDIDSSTVSPFWFAAVLAREDRDRGFSVGMVHDPVVVGLRVMAMSPAPTWSGGAPSGEDPQLPAGHGQQGEGRLGQDPQSPPPAPTRAKQEGPPCPRPASESGQRVHRSQAYGCASRRYRTATSTRRSHPGCHRRDARLARWKKIHRQHPHRDRRHRQDRFSRRCPAS